MSIVENRKAFHDYFIEERYEAGIALAGWEVKAIRAGRATIGEAYDAIAALLPQAQKLKRRDYDESDFTIFGPFLQGNFAALQQRVDGNAVLRHQVQQIESDGNDVSVAAPAFLVMQTPGGNRHIQALYQPSTNLVLERTIDGEVPVDEYLRRTGASLKEFHDALLQTGYPPIPIARKILFGER